VLAVSASDAPRSRWGRQPALRAGRAHNLHHVELHQNVHRELVRDASRRGSRTAPPSESSEHQNAPSRSQPTTFYRPKEVGVIFSCTVRRPNPGSAAGCYRRKLVHKTSSIDGRRVQPSWLGTSSAESAVDHDRGTLQSAAGSDATHPPFRLHVMDGDVQTGDVCSGWVRPCLALTLLTRQRQ
jgi:hypothetical protein